MHRFKFLFIILIFISLDCIAQNKQFLKNEIGVSSSLFEVNSETMNHPLTKKFVNGLYYSRHLSNFSWGTNLEYGENQMNDVCSPNCYDAFEGIGKMSEFILTTGFRSRFFKKSDFELKPFIELDIYYSHIRYSGIFQGGFSGAGTQFDNSFNMHGLLLKAGLTYIPISKICLTISSSYRIGRGKMKNNYNNTIVSDGSYAATLLNFRIGYLF